MTADDVTRQEIVAAVDRPEALVREDEDAFGPLEITLNPSVTDGVLGAGTVYLTTVALPGDVNSDEAGAALTRLRDEIVPEAFDGTGSEVFVGGQTAIGEDFFDVVNVYTPIVFVLVLGLSFLLLLMVFRSLIVPIKAIIMNLLSIGAAYGMLVLIFQEGVGADPLGFQRVETIEAWVPLFLFMIPVRPLDGLPRLPAEPDPRALRPGRRQRQLGRLRAARDGEHHHGARRRSWSSSSADSPSASS